MILKCWNAPYYHRFANTRSQTLYWYVKHAIEMATLYCDKQPFRCTIGMFFINVGHTYIHTYTYSRKMLVYVFMNFICTHVPFVQPHPQSPIDVSPYCSWMWVCEWTCRWCSQPCTSTWTRNKIICMKPIGPSSKCQRRHPHKVRTSALQHIWNGHGVCISPSWRIWTWCICNQCKEWMWHPSHNI